MGLKTLPCGTPLMHVLKLDNAELICTLCFLFVRKDFMYVCIHVSKYVHACMCVSMYECICICMYVYIDMYICMLCYMCACIFMHVD